MIKTLTLSAVLAVGLSSFASAAIMPAPVGADNAAVVRVAGGCGAGWFRDVYGRCRPAVYHPYYRPYPYYPYYHHCWWRNGVRVCN